MFTKIVRFQDLSEKEIARWSEFICTQPGYESPFFHPHFTRTVSRFRDDALVVLHGSGDDVDVFLPIQISGRSAYPIGAPFSDYHGPVTAADWKGDLSQIIEEAGLTSYNYTALYDLQNRYGDNALERDGAYVCDIAMGPDQYFESRRELFPKHAKKMRRLTRKIDREVGETVFAFDDRDEHSFQTLLEWKSQQYRSTGRHDVLSPPWVRSMLKTLWLEGVDGCRGFLHTLKANGVLISAEFNICSEKTVHGWIPAYNQRFSSFAPGYLIQERVIAEAGERGFREYDLGMSAGHYKKYYASFQLPLISGAVRSSGLRAAVGNFGEAAWRKVETANVPKVSALAGKVRRRYGMIRTVETSFGGKMRGVLQAAGQIARSSGSQTDKEDAQAND